MVFRHSRIEAIVRKFAPRNKSKLYPAFRPPALRPLHSRAGVQNMRTRPHAPARARTHMHTLVHAGELWMRSVAGARR